MSHNQYATLDNFLESCKYIKNENKCTHTRIGSSKYGIYGGSYSIPEEKMEEFYSLYIKKVFGGSPKMEYLTEIQDRKNGGPILVDFDFRHEKHVTERQFDEDTISSIVDHYVEKLQELIKIKDEIKFPIYIFIKDELNVNDDVINKDGIHMVIGLHMDHITQQMLRNLVKKNIYDEIFGDLKLNNSIDDILDEGITKGQTGWQMYGSRKPGYGAYKIKNKFMITIKNLSNSSDELDDGIQIDEILDLDFDMCDFIPVISAKNKNFEKVESDDKFKEEYAKYEKYKKKKNIKLNKCAKSNDIVENDMLEGIENVCNNLSLMIVDEKSLDLVINNYILNADITEYHLKEIHHYAMLLNESFYIPYKQWIAVGMALHHEGKYLFYTWVKFSQKSENFKFENVSEMWALWKNMRMSNDDGQCYTERSIKYWAKECDSDEFLKIKNDTTTQYLENTLLGQTDNDIALLTKHLFRGRFKCVAIKGNIWYEFKNHRWMETDSGTELKRKLSTVVSKLYMRENMKVLNKIRNTENMPQDEQERLTKIGNIYNGLSMKVRNNTPKTKIMNECKEVFYQKGFENRLDVNPYLICFKNGVFDFDTKEFRDGVPEDYISKCTGIDYVIIDKDNKEHVQIIDEINVFMEQLFPDKELRRYMWEHAASSMIGTTDNQTFNIYNGAQGSNGKSIFVTFMGYILGEYKGTVPISLITQKRCKVGQSSSEVAQLRGIRYACMNEPSKGDAINEGIMKEITGGDPIQGRELYKQTVTFTPQFKLVACTNSLFKIESMDGGTWRRIRVVEFESRFIQNPSDDPQDNEFKIDKKIPKKLKKWAPIFASMLVDIACRTNGNVKDCEMVLKARDAYQMKQDYLSKFYNEKIIEATKSDKISKTAIQEEFKNWYEMEYGIRAPGMQDLEDFLNKKCGKYKRQGWWGYKIKYESYNDSDVETDDES